MLFNSSIASVTENLSNGRSESTIINLSVLKDGVGLIAYGRIAHSSKYRQKPRHCEHDRFCVFTICLLAKSLTLYAGALEK